MYHRCNWNSKKVFFKKKTKGTFSWQNQRWAHIQIRGKKKYREGWKLVLCSVALNEKVEVMVSSFASFTSGWRCLTWVVQIVETGCMLLPLLSQVRRVRLCEPIVGSPPGSLVPGIFQARTLEWVAIAFSNAWKWKVTLHDPMDCSLPGSSIYGIFQARVLECRYLLWLVVWACHNLFSWWDVDPAQALGATFLDSGSRVWKK